VIATTARVAQRPALFALLLALVSAGLVMLGAKPASAATGNILPPFDIGQTCNICQGYNGPVSHTGNSLYGLDLTGARCDNSAAGRNVRASVDGTVSYYQGSTGTLCINIAGGRSYALTHIDSSITSGSVTAGQVVGTVASAGNRGNSNLAHLHFQIWGGQRTATTAQSSHSIPHTERASAERQISRHLVRTAATEYGVAHRLPGLTAQRIGLAWAVQHSLAPIGSTQGISSGWVST